MNKKLKICLIILLIILIITTIIITIFKLTFFFIFYFIPFYELGDRLKSVPSTLLKFSGTLESN